MAPRKLSTSPNAIRQRAERAAAKEAKRAALASGIELPETLEVEVVAGPPEEPKTLKDRLFGFIKAEEPAKKAPGRKKAGDNLLTTALPTVAASFIATYSQQLLAEEYRRCAPSKEEVAAIIAPIMDVIGRRVEVVGKASQDAIDMANAILATFMYSTRAYIAYVDIKRGNHAEEKKAGVDASAAGDRTVRTDQRTSAGAGRSSADRDEPERQSEAKRSDPVNGAGGHGDAPGATRTEADIFADMLRRDRQGRIGLGLLSGALPGSNNHAHPAA